MGSRAAPRHRCVQGRRPRRSGLSRVVGRRRAAAACIRKLLESARARRSDTGDDRQDGGVAGQALRPRCRPTPSRRALVHVAYDALCADAGCCRRRRRFIHCAPAKAGIYSNGICSQWRRRRAAAPVHARSTLRRQAPPGRPSGGDVAERGGNRIPVALAGRPSDFLLLA